MPGTAAAAAGTAAVAAAAASAAGAPAGLMADMIAGIKTPLSRSIACPAPRWLAALDRSPSRPPLPLVAAGAMASDGSPRIGYVPAAGSNPMGAEIGTSPGAGSAAALEIGDARAGSTPVVGLVRPGVVRPGVRPVAPMGLVSAGLVSAGLLSAGSVRAGAAAVAGDSPGVVSGDIPNPGVVNGAVPSPGEVNVVGMDEPEPVSRLVGIGGRLIPNCDRPCERADISSLGRSVIMAAWTNWRCCVGGLMLSDKSDMATIAAGLATARAATALMAVESLRRRRFGTEVSSIYGLRLVAVSGCGLDRAEPIHADVIDGTGVTVGVEVAIRNCEPIATFNLVI